MVGEVAGVRFFLLARHTGTALVVFKMKLVVPKAVSANPLDVNVERRRHITKRENVTKADTLDDAVLRATPLFYSLFQARNVHAFCIRRRVVARSAVLVGVNDFCWNVATEVVGKR